MNTSKRQVICLRSAAYFAFIRSADIFGVLTILHALTVLGSGDTAVSITDNKSQSCGAYILERPR